MRLSFSQLLTWIYCDKVTRCLNHWSDTGTSENRAEGKSP